MLYWWLLGFHDQTDVCRIKCSATAWKTTRFRSTSTRSCYTSARYYPSGLFQKLSLCFHCCTDRTVPGPSLTQCCLGALGIDDGDFSRFYYSWRLCTADNDIPTVFKILCWETMNWVAELIDHTFPQSHELFPTFISRSLSEIMSLTCR